MSLKIHSLRKRLSTRISKNNSLDPGIFNFDVWLKKYLNQFSICNLLCDAKLTVTSIVNISIKIMQ